MYGQTEATARMAYLPPALLERHPQAIGRADPRWPPRGPPGRRAARRRRRARLPRAERHARVRHGAVRPRRGATSTSCRPVTSPGSMPTTACSRSSADGRGSSSRSACASTSTPSRPSWPPPGSTPRSTGDDDQLVVCAPGAPADEVRRRVASLTGLPAGHDPHRQVGVHPAHVERQGRLRAHPAQPARRRRRHRQPLGRRRSTPTVLGRGRRRTGRARSSPSAATR